MTNNSHELYVCYGFPFDHSGWQVISAIFTTLEEAQKYAEENKGNFTVERIKKYTIGTDFEDFSNEDVQT